MSRYGNTFTQLEWYNFKKKLLNSNLNFTETELKHIEDDYAEARRRVSNSCCLIWKVKDGIDLKDTQQFKTFNNKLFKDFNFSVRENARYDVHHLGHGNKLWKIQSRDEQFFLDESHIIHRRLYDLGETKILYNQIENEKFRYDTELTLYHIKEKKGPRDWDYTPFSIVHTKVGDDKLNVETNVKYLVSHQSFSAGDKEDQKEIKEKYDSYKKSAFVKNIVNEYFTLIDEHYDNYLNI